MSAPILISRPDTVVLGLGFATLVPPRGITPMVVAPNTGVKVSGLIFDAGPVNSPVLLSVGTPLPAAGSASDPDTIQDVFFRIGGAETTTTSATVSLLDNASNSIIDDVWAWRADHGNDVGWTANKGDTGVVVTGNNVTAYGLAVEHYQKSEVVWTGQGGTDVFFQNELPYDVPSQSAWNESSTFSGYPAFQVGSGVKTFHGYGMGSYVVFIDTSATLNVTEAFQAPQAPGVKFSDVFGVWIGGSGGLDSIVNGTGGPVNSTTDPASSPRWTWPATPADLRTAARGRDRHGPGPAPCSRARLRRSSSRAASPAWGKVAACCAENLSCCGRGGRTTRGSCTPSCTRTPAPGSARTPGRGCPSRSARARRTGRARRRRPRRTPPSSRWPSWRPGSSRARRCCGGSTCTTGPRTSGSRCGPPAGAAASARTRCGCCAATGSRSAACTGCSWRPWPTTTP